MRNASGIWTSVAANTQRHHYVVPGVSGLLVESAGGAPVKRSWRQIVAGFATVLIGWRRRLRLNVGVDMNVAKSVCGKSFRLSLS